MNIDIIDNAIDEKDFRALESVISNVSFPWYLQYYLNNKNEFSHLILDDGKVLSDYYNFTKPILDIIKAKHLVRIKVNLYNKTHQIEEPKPTIDYTNMDTSIFYLNTNNGYTNFGEKKVESVKNRLITFNSNTKHSDSTCTDMLYRVLIKINYTK